MSEMVPKVRFSSFTDDWEERKLGEVIDIENGYAFKSEYFSEEEKRHIVLTPGSVKIGGGFQKDKGRYYDVSGVFPEKFIFKPGNIFITMTDLTPTAQSLGYPAIVPKDDNVYLHNQRLGKIINTTTNPEFLYTLLTTDTYHKEIVSSASGTTVKHSSVSKILDFKNAIPNIDEQKLIGSFFKELDNTIALHQRKLDLLKEQKKGFLQKMFPKNGSRVPELRFSGFADDWEQRKLKDIANYRNGKAHEQVEDIDGQFTIVNSKFISTNGNVQRHTYKQVEPLFKGEITFVLSDLPNGKALAKVFRIDEDNKYTLNQRIAGITPKKGTDSIFLSYILNRNSYFLKFDSGVSQTNLSRSQVEGFTSTLPCFEEQTEIGSFFKQLDNLITLHQRKLDLLKEQKKGFLQKMFVS